MQRMGRWTLGVGVVAAIAVTVACGPKKTTPIVRPQPPAATSGGNELGTTPQPGPPPAPVRDDAISVAPAVPDGDAIGSRNLDELNRASPLQPVYFALDSFELSADARTILQSSAQVLKQQGSWQVTVEGHCDERGTAEYNLSLGERRALAAKTYLVSLGIAADRLRTVSYGKEFPFDPGHDEAAWGKNRRAHFVITAK